jgi:hypothetical protein
MRNCRSAECGQPRFQRLTRAQIAPKIPFCTIDPTVGIVPARSATGGVGRDCASGKIADHRRVRRHCRIAAGGHRRGFGKHSGTFARPTPSRSAVSITKTSCTWPDASIRSDIDVINTNWRLADLAGSTRQWTGQASWSRAVTRKPFGARNCWRAYAALDQGTPPGPCP